MAPDVRTQRLTFVLLFLATAATEVAVDEARPLAASLAWAGLWSGLAVGLGRLAPARTRARPPWYLAPLLLALLAVPFLVEPVRRPWTGEGLPLELLMILGLRNAGLGLAAFTAWPVCQRLACSCSLFLMLFAVSLIEVQAAAVSVLLALYGAAGSVWLMLVHWAERQTAPATLDLRVAAERERLPWLPALVVVLFVGGALGLLAVGPQRTARLLGELLPTSGGTGAHDPFARGGLNDGDDEVAGPNARGTGSVDSNTFIDSPLPSLYDLFNDLYGEPLKKRQDQDRAVALDVRDVTVNETGRKPPDNLGASRQFSTARTSPRRPRDPADRAARALFEVQGRTPLHVRAAAFERFDGTAWQEVAPARVSLIDREEGTCWMSVRRGKTSPVFAAVEAHQFRVTKSSGPLLPAPPHLERFRLGRVDDPGFFAWGPERILRLAHRDTPAGVTLHTEARVADPRRLEQLSFPPLGDVQRPQRRDPELAALARHWAGDRPSGWGQIEAVIHRLRTDYVHDADARPPVACPDPLRHFLLADRCGPDYQFAGAAVLLLRELGYPARLASGFYAAPAHYDPQARATPVVADDVHFWAEVRLPSGDWLVLEPTPGFDVLTPPVSWPERLAACLRAAAWPLSLTALALAGLWWRRRELLDRLGLVGWRWFPSRSWRQTVRRCVGLLERRCRWTGRPRPPARTVRHWLNGALAEPTLPAELDRLARFAEWAAYAPELAPPWAEGEVVAVCESVLASWTLRRLRAARGGARE